jgi:hypothetical protein
MPVPLHSVQASMSLSGGEGRLAALVALVSVTAALLTGPPDDA